MKRRRICADYKQQTMNSTKITVGKLSVTQVASTDKPKGAIVLCHGFGAGGDDLVSIADEMVKADGGFKHFAFLFPEAPIDMSAEAGFESRAWWMIDVDEIQRLGEASEFDALKAATPDGLPGCNAMVKEVIDYVRSEFELPLSKIVIGGFSQGAMVTTDVALSLEEPVGGLIVWSGTVICESKWQALAADSSFPVYQSHGTLDPILPFDVAVDLCTMFSEAGIEIEFTEFDGPHTISISAMKGAMKLVRKALL